MRRSAAHNTNTALLVGLGEPEPLAKSFDSSAQATARVGFELFDHAFTPSETLPEAHSFLVRLF